MVFCPKCGTDNTPDKSACEKCAAPLTPPGRTDSVTGRHLGGPLGGGPPEPDETPQTSVGQPLGGPAPQGQPYTQQPTQPPRMRYTAREETSSRGSGFNFFNMLYSLVVAAVVFGGGGYLVYQFYYLPKGPTEITRKFCVAVGSGNTQALDSTLSAASRKWFEGMPDSDKQKIFNFFNNKDAGWEEGREYEIHFGKVDGKWAKVNVAPGPTPLDTFKDSALPTTFTDGVPISLVKEGDNWRVDLVATYEARNKAGF